MTQDRVAVYQMLHGDDVCHSQRHLHQPLCRNVSPGDAICACEIPYSNVRCRPGVLT